MRLLATRSVASVSLDEIDEVDAEKVREQRVLGTRSRNARFVALMGQREFRRDWIESVSEKLFQPKIATEKAMTMMGRATERDIGLAEWMRARELCPELLLLAQQEEHERTRSRRRPERPTE